MIHVKGQIDALVGNTPDTNSFYGVLTWIQGLVQDNIDLSNIVQSEFASSKTRIKNLEYLLRTILGIEGFVPAQEIVDRAKNLGEFYTEIRKRASGET